MQTLLNRNLISCFAFFTCFLIASPAHADVIWPALFIMKGMLNPLIIIAGLITEIYFIKRFTDVSWKKASWVGFLMNLITAVIGIFVIPISGLVLEGVLYNLAQIYSIFDAGSFHWSHWLLNYVLIILFNTLIEGLFIKFVMKLQFKKIFGWLLGANALSVAYCFAYIFLVHAK